MAFVQALFSWPLDSLGRLASIFSPQKPGWDGPEANEGPVSKACSPDVSVYSTLFWCFNVFLSVGRKR